jgi:outer membrane lipoprotein-sorting protein
MSVMDSVSDPVRRRLIWTVPVAVVGGVAVVVALTSASASGAPNLPSRTPAQLIAAVEGSTATALSGQISETASLGIPSLPGQGSSASLSWQTFVAGTHSARVWIDGPDKQRVALLGQLSEADVVHNGPDVWTYTSDTNSVSHSVLPAEKPAQKDNGPSTEPDATDATPTAMAARILKAITPTTLVSIDSSRTVAGRDAYTLVLQPRDAHSTVQSVKIAVDATKYIPLQVQIFGSGSTPAFQTGFTSISFTKPSASTFNFHVPAGATVTKDPFGPQTRHGDRPGPGPRSSKPDTHASASPKVIGSGWTSVVELPSGLGAQVSGSLLDQLTSRVGSSGVRLLHTALINAVLMPDGRAFVGAVSPAVLEHIAATTH